MPYVVINTNGARFPYPTGWIVCDDEVYVTKEKAMERRDHLRQEYDNPSIKVFKVVEAGR